MKLILLFAGFLGSMIGMSLLHASYLIIGISRGASIDAIRPLAVILIGVPLGYKFPGILQLLGGTLILLASVILVRLRYSPKMQNHVQDGEAARFPLSNRR